MSGASEAGDARVGVAGGLGGEAVEQLAEDVDMGASYSGALRAAVTGVLHSVGPDDQAGHLVTIDWAGSPEAKLLWALTERSLVVTLIVARGEADPKG
jgi:hypothetical protein